MNATMASAAPGIRSEDNNSIITTNTPEQSPKSKTNPFSCNLCGRSYSRVDHLARHYRSHTHEKPFVCVICKKGFSRADLLKRHTTSHNGLTSSKNVGGSSRLTTRVAQACVACATAKLRCGHQRPCQRCQQKGITCKLPPQSEKSRLSPYLDGPGGMQGKYSMDIETGTLLRQSEISASTSQLPDTDTLEGAATLSSLDGVTRNYGSLFTGTRGVVPYDLPMRMDTIAPGSPQISGTDDEISINDNPLEEDVSLTDFLRDIIVPTKQSLPDLGESITSIQYPGLDLFNFGMHSGMDFDNMDLGWTRTQNYDRSGSWDSSASSDDDQPPKEIVQASEGIIVSAEAFSKSVWRRWRPTKQDHAYIEQKHLCLPQQNVQMVEARSPPNLLMHQLQHDSRDQILGMLITACETRNIARILASFPPAEFLDSLVRTYFTAPLAIDFFIHSPTFDPARGPELTAIVAAAGAVMSPVTSVRKFGFAIQEALRTILPAICDKDNSKTRQLNIIQSFALELGVSMFSANTRKMEIAQGHSQVLITMLRSPGRYRRQPASAAPTARDDAEILERKWQDWVQADAFKRVAIHTLIHDAQVSFSLLLRPTLSYTEMSLELPQSLDLWRARTADEWRDVWLAKVPMSYDKLPSFGSCVINIELIREVQDWVDVDLTVLAVLHALWTLISDRRQQASFMKPQYHVAEPVSSEQFGAASWRQELYQLLDRFTFSVSSFRAGFSQESYIIKELYKMNLQVSNEDLQLFAGREGTNEAHRVYPLLKTWYGTREARQALSHAGNIVQAMNTAPFNRLRDIHVCIIYQCALCMWAWGVCAIGSGHAKEASNQSNRGENCVWLDSNDTAAIQEFIATGHGTPMLHGFNDEATNGYSLYNPKGIMEMMYYGMEKTCSFENTAFPPPIVENHGPLMKDLGNAAWIVSSQSLRSTLPRSE